MLKLVCDNAVSYIASLEEQNVRSKANHLEIERTTFINDCVVCSINRQNEYGMRPIVTPETRIATK